jgi:hypothetical protein
MDRIHVICCICVTQYCRKAPELETCQRGMTAYTTLSLFSKTTGSLVSLSDVNHCICPERANYEVVDSKFDDVDDEIESMETTYVCNPVRMCTKRRNKGQSRDSRFPPIRHIEKR